MLIIAGRLQVDPAERDQYVADCIAVVTQARTAPGCLDFAITADSVEPDRVNVFERWESDALSKNFAGRARTPARRPQLRDAPVRKNRISATEDP